MTLLKPGTKAPIFSLPADNGVEFNLSDHLGKPVILFFYPKADTPGCTIESQDFSSLTNAFEKLGAIVVGISADTVTEQCDFRDKYGLKVPLLADPDHKVLNAFGVWGEKTNFGKTYMGIIRSTFLIAPDGTIAEAWKVARVAGHADKVLEATKKRYG